MKRLTYSYLNVVGNVAGWIFYMAMVCGLIVFVISLCMFMAWAAGEIFQWVIHLGRHHC